MPKAEQHRLPASVTGTHLMIPTIPVPFYFAPMSTTASYNASYKRDARNAKTQTTPLSYVKVVSSQNIYEMETTAASSSISLTSELELPGFVFER
jgi:hypothetical protein